MEVWPLVVAALGMFAGGAAAGAVGFGAVLVPAPIIAVVSPALVPFVFAVPVIGVDSFVAWRERAALDRGLLVRLLLWQVPGAVVGTWVLGRIDEQALTLTVGALILGFLGLRLTPFSPPRTRPWEVVAALMAGVSGSISGANGPPLAALLANDHPAVMRATLPAFFVVAQFVLLTTWSVAGVMRIEAVAAGAVYLPVMLAGGWVGQRLTGRLTPVMVRNGVLALATIAVARSL